MFTIIISIMPLSSYRQHTINCTNTFFLASTVFDVNTISCIHYCTSTIDRANEVKTYRHDLNTVLEEDEVAEIVRGRGSGGLCDRYLLFSQDFS
jgi:hypothetical protein